MFDTLTTTPLSQYALISQWLLYVIDMYCSLSGLASWGRTYCWWVSSPTGRLRPCKKWPTTLPLSSMCLLLLGCCISCVDVSELSELLRSFSYFSALIVESGTHYGRQTWCDQTTDYICPPCGEVVKNSHMCLVTTAVCLMCCTAIHLTSDVELVFFDYEKVLTVVRQNSTLLEVFRLLPVWLWYV